MHPASSTKLNLRNLGRSQSCVKVQPRLLTKLLAIRTSIVAMEDRMLGSFLDGILVVLMPSMLMVAWLAWRATAVDLDF